MTTLPTGTITRTRPIDRPSWLPAEVWPFELKTLTLTDDALGETTIAYTDHGPERGRRKGRTVSTSRPTDAPTLLFVHTGMWSFVFRDVIGLLASDHRCLTLDFPGHGLSPEPASPATLADHGRVLGAFVDELGLDDVVLVLHDLGGLVGMGAAADRTDRIGKLVLANTFLWAPDGRALRAMLRIVSSGPITGLDRLTGAIPRLTSTGGGVGRHLDRPSKRAFVAGMRQPRRTARFHQLMRDALRADGLHRSAEAATRGELRNRPVLTIFGEKNDPFGFQDRLHELFPDHRGVVIEGGNHFPMMDDPKRFADEVRRFTSPGS